MTSFSGNLVEGIQAEPHNLNSKFLSVHPAYIRRIPLSPTLSYVIHLSCFRIRLCRPWGWMGKDPLPELWRPLEVWAWRRELRAHRRWGSRAWTAPLGLTYQTRGRGVTAYVSIGFRTQEVELGQVACPQLYSSADGTLTHCWILGSFRAAEHEVLIFPLSSIPRHTHMHTCTHVQWCTHIQGHTHGIVRSLVVFTCLN